MGQLGFALFLAPPWHLTFPLPFGSIRALLGARTPTALCAWEQADNSGHMQADCKYVIPLTKQFAFNAARGAERHLASSAKVVFSV